jgi:hypothetical protein
MQDVEEMIEKHRKGNEVNLEIFKQRVKETGSMGTSCSLLLGLSKKKDEEWKLAYGELVFGQDVADTFDDAWPRFRIIHRSVSPETAFKVVEQLCTAGSIALSDTETVPAAGGLIEDRRPSHSGSKQFKTDWPVHSLAFQVDSPCLGSIMLREPLVDFSLPFYPEPAAALAEHAIWQFGDNPSYIQGQLRIILIDRRARFSSVIVDAKRITLDVEWGSLTPDESLVKAHVAPNTGEPYSVDVGDVDGQYHLTYDEIPKEFDIAIVSKEGNRVDWRSHRSYSDWDREGIVIAVSTEELRIMILQGENETVEFKANAHKKKRDDVLETIVAFANHRGGAILFGVDDNSNVIGLEEGPEGVEDRLRKWIRSHVEPPVDIDTRYVDEDDVLVVMTKESKNKPYNLRDKGFYIRSGSTDRLITRAEMDEIYSGVPRS